jgi:cytochrome c5
MHDVPHKTRLASMMLIVAALAFGAATGLAGCAETTDDTSVPAESQETPDEEASEDEPAADPAEGEAEPVSEGDALIDAKCTGCHSRTRVDSAQKDREQWEATVERMIRAGADLTPEEQETIVEFLSTG